MQDQKRKCKSCGLDKIFNFYKLGTNGSLLYKDGEGKLWKGWVCSDCQSKKRTEQRKQAKAATKPESGS